MPITNFTTKIPSGVQSDDFDIYFIPKSFFQQGNIWTWGSNGYGNLGNNSSTTVSSPVQILIGGVTWKQAAAGYGFGAAIRTDGTLWTWGAGNIGQTGTNANLARSSPGQTVAAGSNWMRVAGGGNAPSNPQSAQDFCYAIKTDGTLWTWGYNGTGTLGDNTTLARSSPVQVTGGSQGWASLSYGMTGNHAMAIKSDGTLWTWGSNASGQLGTNATLARSSPGQTIAGGSTWVQVASGGASSAGIKSDGTLWTWGSNSYGQLGINSTTGQSSPTQTISQTTTWKQVAIGTQCAAIKTDGTLWVWGQNGNGELGDNTTTNKSSPVQTIATGTNWKKVSRSGVFLVIASNSFCGAVKTDGTLWMWGRNSGTAALGTNDLTSYSSPVQTIATGANWIDIFTGGFSSIGIQDGNTYI